MTISSTPFRKIAALVVSSGVDAMADLLKKAKLLDQTSPEAAALRAQFPSSEIIAGAAHSLGRPARSAVTVVVDFLRRLTTDPPHHVHWGRDAQENKARNFAYKQHLQAGMVQAYSALLGAKPTDVMAGNGLSNDLADLLGALYHPDIWGARNKILCLQNDFNSDKTLVMTLIQQRLKDAVSHPSKRNALRDEHHAKFDALQALFEPGADEAAQFAYIQRHYVVEIPISDGLRYDPNVIQRTIAASEGTVAAALLPTIVFNTGQLLPVAAMNEVLLTQGVPCVWDCAHSVGCAPHHFEEDQIVAAAGCGYKHVSGTPGAPGFVYTNETLLRERGIVFSPVSGWLANGRTGDFDVFAKINVFSPDTLHSSENVQRLRKSNPEPMALRVVAENLKAINDFGVPQWFAHFENMTLFHWEVLETAFADHLREGRVQFVTPKDPCERGAMISLRVTGVDLNAVEKLMTGGQNGVRAEIDVRPPDIIRITAHPFHMSFEDVVRMVGALRSAIDASAI